MINFLRKKKNETVFTQNRRKKEFLNFDSIKNVVVIFNTGYYDEVAYVIEALKTDGKNVSAWTTYPKDKAVKTEYPANIRAIDLSKELTWSQTLAKTVTDEFENLVYDTFLDLTVSDDSVLDYLLAVNCSRFCIGIRERAVKVYDFILLKKEETSIPEIYEQMKYYLSNNIS